MTLNPPLSVAVHEDDLLPPKDRFDITLKMGLEVKTKNGSRFEILFNSKQSLELFVLQLRDYVLGTDEAPYYHEEHP